MMTIGLDMMPESISRLCENVRVCVAETDLHSKWDTSRSYIDTAISISQSHRLDFSMQQ